MDPIPQTVHSFHVSRFTPGRAGTLFLYHVRVRYLGVDPGGRRMGLAVGDDATGTVVPLEVLPYHGAAEAARMLARRAEELEARAIVLGLPLGADGEPTPACARSHALARELEGLGLTVMLQGEYLTTNEARRRAREAGLPAREPVDHLAAQVLLEEYMERQRCGGS